MSKEKGDFDPNPRTGVCLCGGAATIFNTKAADGRIQFRCHKVDEVGHAIHFGFVLPPAYVDLGQEPHDSTAKSIAL